jgi:hypothetical protein
MVIYILHQILNLHRQINIDILYTLYFVMVLYHLGFVYAINKYCLILIRDYFN